MEVNAKLKIKTPTLPNFLIIEHPDGNDNVSIPIDAVSDRELEKIGNEWTTALIEKAQKKRKCNR